MSAATAGLGRRRPVPLAGPGRLLRIEVRRNSMRVLVPLLAALVWFDAYRTAMEVAPVWDLRESVLTSQLPQDWEALVAGVGAWVGSREERRHISDLVTPTVRPVWARRVLALAATVGWVLAAYLAFVGVLFGVTAGQATWGGPDWWPVAVGAAALTCVCGIGFAAGVFVPSRLTAPVTAIGIFMLSMAGARATGFRLGNPVATQHRQVLSPALTGSGDALLSPSGGTPSIRIGVYYPYLPDLAIAQLLLLAGLTVAVLGVLGLRRGPDARAGLRRAATAVAVAGLAAAGTAIGLASTAYQTAQGVLIPALHDAASDRPVPYTPVCAGADGVPVCVHPALRGILPNLTAALGPVLAQLAGVAGAPLKVDPDPAPGPVGEISWLVGGMGQTEAFIGGSPPELYLRGLPPQGSFGTDTAGFTKDARAMVALVLTTPPGVAYAVSGSQGTPAQQAVALALLQDSGVQVQPGCSYGQAFCAPAPGTAQYLAFRRFAALPAANRHAWLAAHLTALRAGRVTLAQLP
jgi:hypothetical protein